MARPPRTGDACRSRRLAARRKWLDIPRPAGRFATAAVASGRLGRPGGKHVWTSLLRNHFCASPRCCRARIMLIAPAGCWLVGHRARVEKVRQVIRPPADGWPDRSAFRVFLVGWAPCRDRHRAAATSPSSNAGPRQAPLLRLSLPEIAGVVRSVLTRAGLSGGEQFQVGTPASGLPLRGFRIVRRRKELCQTCPPPLPHVGTGDNWKSAGTPRAGSAPARFWELVRFVARWARIPTAAGREAPGHAPRSRWRKRLESRIIGAAYRRRRRVSHAPKTVELGCGVRG